MNEKRTAHKTVAELLDEQELRFLREERLARLVAVAAMVAFGIMAALVIIGTARLAARPCECSPPTTETP